MKIGVARIDITPALGTSMCGQLADYKGAGIESMLYTTAMCINDGMNCMIIVNADVLVVTNELAEELTSEISGSLDIQQENIIICATHTHSGPATITVLGASENAEYIQYFKLRILLAVRNAFESQKEAYLQSAETDLEGLAFNRRYIMSSGSVSTHPMKNHPHIVEAEGPASTKLNVLGAYDKSGKCFATIVCFGCHPTVMSRNNNQFSADYPGKIADHISRETNGENICMFILGASGNICQVDPLNTSTKEIGVEWMKYMGKEIGEKTLITLSEGAIEITGRMQMITETLAIPRRHLAPELVEWALRHNSSGSTAPELSNYGVELYSDDQKERISLDLLFETPFWADFYANEIRILKEKKNKNPHVQVKLKILTFKNFAFVAIPGELFVEWAQIITRSSPFKHTMIATLANGWVGYIPTQKSFMRPGGYETKDVTSSFLVPEAGQLISNTIIKMLKSAYSEPIGVNV